MKRITIIIILWLWARPAAGQDTSSWDMSSIIGFDAEREEMVVATADPVSGDTAMRVYKMMQGFIGALVEEHVKTKDGTCFAGYRSVVDGRSTMRYLQSSCIHYAEYWARWQAAVAKVMQSAKSTPLEESIKKSQKP